MVILIACASSRLGRPMAWRMSEKVHTVSPAVRRVEQQPCPIPQMVTERLHRSPRCKSALAPGLQADGELIVDVLLASRASHNPPTAPKLKDALIDRLKATGGPQPER